MTCDGGHFYYGDYSEGFDFPEGKVRPHRHPYFEIFYLSRAKGTFLADFVTYPVEDDCLVFISPGQVHGWPGGGKLRGRMISFDQAFVADHDHPDEMLIRSPLFYESTVVPVVQVGENPLVGSLFAEIAREFHHTCSDSLTALRSLLHLLIIQAHRMHSHSVPDSPPASIRIYQQFIKLLNGEVPEKNLPSHYAAALGISADHLGQCVRQCCGHSAGSLVRRRIILEAKRLLAHSQLTIAEVAYQLHFKDPSYFSRFFKRHAGVLPTAFRVGQEKT
ncbi:MAG: helix-turn-helix domain-containing protein [Verrucomicrobiaceae bacterium]